MEITASTQSAVRDFIAGVADPVRGEDCARLTDIIAEITGLEPVLWGSIIGFGSYHYTYASGHEGDSPIIALSPRKQALTLYGVIFYGKNTELLPELGPHTTGKGCLYIKRLADIDLEVLKRMIKAAYEASTKSQ